ncbi:YolD-like family protein [Paenibacillus melissococcoides]|uniref:YolD-like family protein n=1 Tax=Paenibacillus melissococcoides TaxID=2912268 RepID=A0ABM9G788_9BACL|nr:MULTISPECIES: YolD-like family protein [Paenibacillus]MEB9894038.1 YolD-like family protein [Bacillus cereus]CAH8247762.1 YolD-like family protein [Paenibacillus melissococcoides]CAH8719616.1 YolD-like family protein [Paenibacillus melissococcoides]CAH8720613.1 YolD-like family protein [Paenibacillus melissococcoides]
MRHVFQPGHGGRFVSIAFCPGSRLGGEQREQETCWQWYWGVQPYDATTEHKQALLAHQENQNRRERPQLDEQEWEGINSHLQRSMMEGGLMFMTRLIKEP